MTRGNQQGFALSVERLFQNSASRNIIRLRFLCEIVSRLRVAFLETRWFRPVLKICYASIYRPTDRTL